MISRAQSLPVTSLALLLGACGGGGGGPVSPGTTDPDPTPPTEVPETPVEGIWETACFPASSPAASRRYFMSITDTTFTFGDTTYGDAACDGENALREIETLGTFDEQLPEDGSRLEDGIPVDLSVEQVTLTPQLSQVATRYNEEMICAAVTAEWMAGVNQDISNCVDESGTIDVDTTAPRIDYNLFLVDEMGTPDVRADDRLLFGTVGSQPDPDRRPGAVSEEVVFTRRPGSP